jgi:hypothetical protein
MMDNFTAREIMEKNWQKIYKKIPAFSLPERCTVRVIPPFAGAAARFLVYPDGADFCVSVYLDIDGSLGWFMRDDKYVPYWEVFGERNEPDRCAMEDVEELERLIKRQMHRDI